MAPCFGESKVVRLNQSFFTTYRIIYPDGSSDRYEYDANDNLLLHIRPDDSTVQMAYDDKDQLIRITDPLGNIWLREYDDKGNLLKEIDPKQYATRYSYNP
ncbi:hypothetical protein ACFQNF_12725 [Iodobacter arcticus]|uniref:RHS repeat protein n=1 Tax=Iodobacter arcticus TaxID=590593 RepID=A0ABW2R0L4_9NEIS